MLFIFSATEMFSYLSSGFMLKNSCLLLFLKPFAFFFSEGMINSLLESK